MPPLTQPPAIRRICLLGAGNVASHLAPALNKVGFTIVNIWAPTLSHAELIAEGIPGCVATDNLHHLPPDADLYLLCVRDDAIGTLAASLPHFHGIWAHTSGSVPIEALQGKAHRGVFYPLQTFTRGAQLELASTPFFIEGSDANTLQALKAVASRLSAVVEEADSQRRQQLHLAAVFACNFANLMWIEAEDIMNHAGLPLRHLLPLIHNTLNKLHTLPARKGLTGPASRGDITVVDRHLQLLVSNPEKHAIYRLLSQTILSNYNAMSKIAYDLRTLRGVAFDVDGVLSPSTIPMDAEGTPQRMVNIKDGYALQLAVKKGLKIAIITGANTPAVDVRYRALGITDIFQGAAQKLPVLQQWMADNGLTPAQTAFVGDDIPDLPCLQYVGLSVVPADGDSYVRSLARYISPVNGGYGVARDLLEETLKAQGLWLSDTHAFGW